jgi:hypothetical protein
VGGSPWPFIIAGSVLLTAGLIANEWVLGLWLTDRGRVTNPASRLTLAAFDLVAVVAGGVLLVRRRRSPWREMLLAAVSTVLALALSEGALRLWFAARTLSSPAERAVAAGIGWRPLANVTRETEVPGFGRVRYTTTTGGFRVFGDPGTPRSKILVLGDSFTEAATVSDGDTYVHRLASARPDLEFFAIGAGGFGTLQEYLLLDEWVDRVKPDLVLLQMHPNDLINNSHALESRSTSNNNQMTRPYWEDGRIVTRFPENQAWGLVYNLARHSHLLRVMNLNLHVLRDRSADGERGFTALDPDVIRATRTTEELLIMVRRRAAVPVVAFSVRSEAYFDFWSRPEVCGRAGVRFIHGVGEAVEAAAARGERVTGAPVDSHWNARGHEIAARVIGDWLHRETMPGPTTAPRRTTDIPRP